MKQTLVKNSFVLARCELSPTALRWPTLTLLGYAYFITKKASLVYFITNICPCML